MGKVYRKYERNERFYKHRIFQMEKVIPLYEYEPLVLFPEQKTSNEIKEKGDTNGASPCKNSRGAKKPHRRKR